MTYQRIQGQRRIAPRAVAALALLAGAVAAQATPITVDFTVTSNDLSNPSYDSGVVGGGYFTFDDTLIPGGGSGYIGNPILGLPTLDLSFNWFGVSFDESNAAIATLTFTDGALTDWMIGGSYLPAACGFLRYSCTSSAGAAADFDALGSGGAALADPGHVGLAYGRPIQWSVRTASVPEPGTMGLFGLGAAMLAVVRRRRVASANV